LLAVVFFVVLAASFGLGCVVDRAGDFGVTALLSPDEASLKGSARDAQRLLAGPILRIGIRAPRLLAAGFGGLCPLI
jgi:hypothetical protein